MLGHMFNRLAARLIKSLYLIYYNTIKISVRNDQWTPRRLPEGQNCIYVFWHAKSFLMLPYGMNSKVVTLTLLDWKNILFGHICRQLHYETVPVTNSASAFIRLRSLVRRGYFIGLALDGPRGPAQSVKKGALQLSKITQRPIVAVNICVKKSYRMKKRWDRYEIPLPFTQMDAILSEPIYVNNENWGETEQKIRDFLKDH